MYNKLWNDKVTIVEIMFSLDLLIMINDWLYYINLKSKYVNIFVIN